MTTETTNRYEKYAPTQDPETTVGFLVDLAEHNPETPAQRRQAVDMLLRHAAIREDGDHPTAGDLAAMAHVHLMAAAMDTDLA